MSRDGTDQRQRGRRAVRERRRTTVQMSRHMLDMVQKVALADGTSYTGVVREAIVWYLSVTAKGARLRSPLQFDAPRRTGRHGPLTRWDAQVTLVIDDDLAGRLAHLAKRRDISIAHLARDAIGHYLTARAIEPGSFWPPTDLPADDVPPRISRSAVVVNETDTGTVTLTLT